MVSTCEINGLNVILKIIALWTTVVKLLILCCLKVESVLAETKNQLNSEMLRRIDMENQVQTLKEQLELQKNISEQVTHTNLRL